MPRKSKKDQVLAGRIEEENTGAYGVDEYRFFLASDGKGLKGSFPETKAGEKKKDQKTNDRNNSRVFFLPE